MFADYFKTGGLICLWEGTWFGDWAFFRGRTLIGLGVYRFRISRGLGSIGLTEIWRCRAASVGSLGWLLDQLVLLSLPDVLSVGADESSSASRRSASCWR